MLQSGNIISCFYVLALRCQRSRVHVKIIHATAGLRSISSVPALASWDEEQFRGEAFLPQTPAALPVLCKDRPLACTKWFTTKNGKNGSPSAELDLSFWEAHADEIVPLEVTRQDPEEPSNSTFDQINAPLAVLLSHMKQSSGEGTNLLSVYLAQHDLRDLPSSILDDLPTPKLVKSAGKGDVYSSSLWLGRSPTYTPLHRDPNPNLFLQLAGTKIVRLFRPEVGDAVFEHSRKLLDHTGFTSKRASMSSTISAAFRGEEMMIGQERTILHDLIWEASSESNNNKVILEHAQEAVLGAGQALFIPKGWWHSVKGVGEGITASANWWFR